ncbi:MAG TPA: FkbM family methyltransferase [Steroidobacteraceae bacterium]
MAQYGIGVVAATRSGLLVVDPHDFSVSRSLLARGAYDWGEICWLTQLLDEHSRIVFVGAHLGALLVPFALRSGSRHIVAFEPSPHNHRLLMMNVALNGLAGITIHHLAAGDSVGTIRFTENRINSGNSRVSRTGEVVVAMTTLDAALPAEWPGTDLLVMDTEGFEVHAIRGGMQSLARARFFYVEYAPDQLAEQGSTSQEFIELIASRFSSMYLPGSAVRFFPSKTYTRYLSELPRRRGLLLNLLFSNELTPERRLLAA